MPSVQFTLDEQVGAHHEYRGTVVLDPSTLAWQGTLQKDGNLQSHKGTATWSAGTSGVYELQLMLLNASPFASLTDSRGWRSGRPQSRWPDQPWFMKGVHDRGSAIVMAVIPWWVVRWTMR
jgi:hypothetical protein